MLQTLEGGDRVQNYGEGDPNWRPPIPRTDEVLRCRWCAYTVPLQYSNQSDPSRIITDPWPRMRTHARQWHYQEQRKARQQAAYQRRKARLEGSGDGPGYVRRALG